MPAPYVIDQFIFGNIILFTDTYDRKPLKWPFFPLKFTLTDIGDRYNSLKQDF